MPTLEKAYEAKHLKLMESGYNKVSRLLKINAEKIAAEIARLQSKQLIFPNKYGSQLLRNKKLLAAIEENFFELEGNLNETINGLTKDQWALANSKNTALVKFYIGKVETQYAHLNLEALAAFQQRNINGLNLSNRIHNLTELNKQLYKDYIGSGITQGKSSIRIARELLEVNNNPTTVKVFDKQGNPSTLGKTSSILKPNAKGIGIYKSPLKNLYRVTRTETNAAYRMSDHVRIQQLDFVVGYEVHTSVSHNILDMCDWMKGKYPKTFVFTGWHPACICYVTTILKTKKEFTSGSNSKNLIKKIPVSAQKYVKTKDMSRYDWHKDNFTKNNNPTGKVGGPSKNIEPYKISVNSKDYRPQPKLIKNAAKIGK